MKKLIALFAVILCANVGTAIAQKLGHVNFQELMLSLPERKLAEDSLRKEATRMEDEIKRMNARYERLVQEFNEDDKAGKLVGAIKENRYAEIMDFQQRISKFEEFAQESLSKKENELLAPMVEKVKAAVGKVAKAQGISYVLDVSQLIFVEGGTDLQSLVKKELTTP